MLAFGRYAAPRGAPKARNLRLSPPEVRDNIRALLQCYGEIEVHCIHDYYRHTFEKSLCAVGMGYPDGLLGYLRSLGRMIEIRNDRHLHFISLNKSQATSQQEALDENETSENDTSIKKSHVHKQLFDRNNYLWTGHLHLFDITNITIEKSAYESAIDCHGSVAEREIRGYRQYLERFNDGIPLTQMTLRRDWYIFNVGSSPNSITSELPEIFYRVERKNDEPLLFSGRTHTINIDEELARTDMTALDSEIITNAINSGLYQQTLILIEQTGVCGLKLNVWEKSILRNFFTRCDSSAREKAEKQFCDMDVINWFLAFARNNLLEIQSSEQVKNDLRAFLPRKPYDYLTTKKKHKDLVNETVSDSNGEPPKFDRKKALGVLRQIQQSK